MTLTSIELCAGAGGQALGLEQAGFTHLACVELDPHAAATLRRNRPAWRVDETDLHLWDPSPYAGRVDLVAGGVPCPPFSTAGKQLGAGDERNLFPRALEIAEAIQPRAVMFENVRGLLSTKFDDYRDSINTRLEHLGYRPEWRLLYASDFAVPQLRPRAIMVATRDWDTFTWPEPGNAPAPTVGQALRDLMAAGGWPGASAWAAHADGIAPTLVGGSKKHGGADLGPTRAKAAWEALGVNGRSLADHPPALDHTGMPRLTVRMAARLQGFPDNWEFTGGKTAQYRQVGNAFPPPVAYAVGRQIRRALEQA